MEPEENISHPIPAPRRLYLDTCESDYENVTVDLVNKNLNINSENINVLCNSTDMLLNNKVFLGALVEGNTNNTTKCMFSETNHIDGIAGNENVNASSNVTLTPVPKPRKLHKKDTQLRCNDNIYENALLMGKAAIPSLSSSQQTHTGTISKGITVTAFPAKSVRGTLELPPETHLRSSVMLNSCSKDLNYMLPSPMHVQLASDLDVLYETLANSDNDSNENVDIDDTNSNSK